MGKGSAGLTVSSGLRWKQAFGQMTSFQAAFHIPASLLARSHKTHHHSSLSICNLRELAAPLTQRHICVCITAIVSRLQDHLFPRSPVRARFLLLHLLIELVFLVKREIGGCVAATRRVLRVCRSAGPKEPASGTKERCFFFLSRLAGSRGVLRRCSTSVC